ncbi:hypothetical protein CEUSTIGMA_g4968.t1 [Chlamydomonas eustigma]|uniref:Uncharacterized protein n=1 Tax=Chlamydomonas eustigma TaxID=1157962 RepID=A0A250X372_9CHLO|nr:hypothetical protein CEUSTIGMA_g4968.t1 [Chlamydomonas eustigma]|eukprot:GAX77524.1 hypothetical protein CEUSTIGMA_g4968.t1 [Chlamydomonas eustigma]
MAEENAVNMKEEKEEVPVEAENAAELADDHMELNAGVENVEEEHRVEEELHAEEEQHVEDGQHIEEPPAEIDAVLQPELEEAPLGYGEDAPQQEVDGLYGYPVAGELEQQPGEEENQQAYLPPLEEVTPLQDHYEQAGEYYDAVPAEDPLNADYQAGQDQYGDQQYNYEMPAGVETEAQPPAEAHYVEQYSEQPAAELDPYSQYNAMPQELPMAPPPPEPAAPAIDIDALLAGERERHEQQLKMESAAREELEDMILRIEKHFKAEQAARKKAEELLQAAIAAEMDAKNKLEDIMKKRQQEQKLLDEERAAISRERHALESMRQEFDSELQAARGEVAKAQEALAGSEERIRAAEQVERARLEAEYQTRVATIQAELERTRDEMAYRTMMMQDEMEKWRQQASMTANAVMEAKNEVQERKRELDNTKEKMDRLLDKLIVGRERGIELSGAIASNQRMMGYLPGMGSMGMPSMGMPPGMGMSPGIAGMGFQGMSMPSAGPHSLPPMMMKPAPPGVQTGPGAQGPWMMAPGMMPPAPSQKIKLPPVQQQDGASYAVQEAAQQQNQYYQAEVEPESSPVNSQYAHVQSKFAQSAAAAAAKGKPKAVNKKKKADRFEEASKEASRNAAMSRALTPGIPRTRGIASLLHSQLG